jgi:hypothetical protein
MNCSEAQRLLYDYLNGELEQLDLSRIEGYSNLSGVSRAFWSIESPKKQPPQS